MKICVVGTGYVGLVSGACLADFGNHVIGADKDEAKIAALLSGKIPIYEPGLRSLVKRNESQGRLSFTTDVATAIRDSEAVFIAVGTPEGEDGSADLKYVRAVARTIGENLTDYKVIVTKSTVPTGTGQMVEEIVHATSGSENFAVVSNPEFLREGSAIEDFMQPDRVVIGTRDERAIEHMLEIYAPLKAVDVPFVITDVESAEMIKYASNGFLATKIAFINEMAAICERYGADVETVARGMGLDNRIGPRFLAPGPGYGGSCFPKDTQALGQIAQKKDVEFLIIDAVVEGNERTKARMLTKIRGAMRGELSGKTVAVLGLSFKPNTDDIRESPALTILGGLLDDGATVRVYDPEAMNECKKHHADLDLVYCENAYDAAEGADALVIVTEWNQFRALDLDRLKTTLKDHGDGPLLIDLRNLYDPKKMATEGFHYISVGRRDVQPQEGNRDG